MVYPKDGSGNGVKPAEKQPNNDLIQRIIGSWGKYQLWICFLIFLTKIIIAFHQMAILFLAPKIEYTCPDTGEETCPCSDPQYDTSVFKNTIIMQWDLICGQKWLSSFNQTMFQMGTLVGSVIFGTASDRFGRRYPLLVAVVIQVAAGIAAAYMYNYWVFTFFRFIIGASLGGLMVVGFVIIMEFVGTEHREIISALYQVLYNLGHMALPLLAFYFREYTVFQLWISIPAVILLCYIYFVPETPRWLIAVKRSEEAIKILENVAKMNKRPTDNIRGDVEDFQKIMEKTQEKKGTLLDLFRTPNLRKNLAAMSFTWMTCSYCFFGVSQYVGQLSGNAFINVAASASVTLLGTFLSIPLMKYIGRKTIIITFNFLCAACLLVLAIIPEGVGSVVCASIGVVCSFIVFIVSYLYCTEVFPTVVRNAALGWSSMTARVGAMVAPFVIDLRDTAVWLPPVVFAILPLIAGCVVFVLPETKGRDLMTTIEEGEQLGKKVKKVGQVKK